MFLIHTQFLSKSLVSGATWRSKSSVCWYHIFFSHLINHSKLTSLEEFRCKFKRRWKCKHLRTKKAHVTRHGGLSMTKKKLQASWNCFRPERSTKTTFIIIVANVCEVEADESGFFFVLIKCEVNKAQSKCIKIRSTSAVMKRYWKYYENNFICWDIFSRELNQIGFCPSWIKENLIQSENILL